MTRLGAFIDGASVRGTTISTIRNPYGGHIVREVALADERQIEDAICSSTRAFAESRSSSRADRAELLQRVVAGIAEQREEFARIICEEAGKPITLARGEVGRCLTTFTLAAEEAKRFTGEMVAGDITPALAGYRVMVERFSTGPLLGITPFNFPLNLVAHKVAPALASGNPIVLKPAPQAPTPAIRLAEIVSQAGAPKGMLNVVPCSNELAEGMVRDERLKMLSFTGSARVGWHLKLRAGRKKVTLELGGNAALIVEKDADVGAVAKKAAIGSFAYAGQVCIAVQRVFANAAVYDEFLDRLIAEAQALPTGDPADESTVVGPLIDEAAADRVSEWIDEAVRGGARVRTGGRGADNVIEPTVVTDAPRDARLSCEEVFGPVVTVESVPDLETAVARANDSAFGLQAGLFTRDIGKVDYAFRNLEVGGLVVNETPMLRIDNYPYGGVKDSGTGREGVRYAMEWMTDPRVLVIAPTAASLTEGQFRN